jgi:hypothetical protein
MQHFIQLGEAVYGVMAKARFLQAIDTWSQCERVAFNPIAPPVDALADGSCDENVILADIFFRLTRKPTLSEQMAVLTFEIIVHDRRLDLAWDRARGERNPRRSASRDAWMQLKPYEAMIEVLGNWAEALYERACEVRL